MTSDYDTPVGGCSECVYYRGRLTVCCHTCFAKRQRDEEDEYLDADD